MAKVTLEQVIAEAKLLTPDEQRQLCQLLDLEVRTAELRRIQSKYAHVTTSSEAFAARKADEIQLEDRQSFSDGQ